MRSPRGVDEKRSPFSISQPLIVNGLVNAPIGYRQYFAFSFLREGHAAFMLPWLPPVKKNRRLFHENRSLSPCQEEENEQDLG